MKYFVNFDYDINFKNKKINFNLKNQYNFEYIYFFLNEDRDSHLCSKYQYDSSYLSKLESFGLLIPIVTGEFREARPWWGNFNNYDVKEKFISKYLLIETLKCTELIPDFVKKIEVGEYVFPEKMYFRGEYGFSGIANRIVNKNEKISLNTRGTISKYLEIYLSFGVTVNIEDGSYFICTNSINSNGNFLGGRIVTCEALASTLQVDKDDFIKQLLEIFKIFEKNGVQDTIQFDSLIYKDGDEYKWYKVVEVNYRKTMGLLIKKLNDVFGCGELILSKTPVENAILISPPNTKLLSYFKKIN